MQRALITGGAGFIATGDSPVQLADAIGAWAASSREVRLAQGSALRDRWRSELDPVPHMARYVAALDSAVASARPSRSRT